MLLFSFLIAASQGPIPGPSLLSICAVESGMNPFAVNENDGGGQPSIGLCQVNARNFNLYPQGLPFLPTDNLLLAGRFISTYCNRPTLKAVSRCYNQGPYRSLILEPLPDTYYHKVSECLITSCWSNLWLTRMDAGPVGPTKITGLNYRTLTGPTLSSLMPSTTLDLDLSAQGPYIRNGSINPFTGTAMCLGRISCLSRLPLSRPVTAGSAKRSMAQRITLYGMALSPNRKKRKTTTLNFNI